MIGIWSSLLELEEPRSGSEEALHTQAAVDEWGRSESLDPDNVGDIADEGAGHRG